MPDHTTHRRPNCNKWQCSMGPKNKCHTGSLLIRINIKLKLKNVLLELILRMKQCYLFHWLFCLNQIIIGQKARNWNCGVSNRLFENRFGKKIARLLPENSRKPKNSKKFKPLTFFELYIWIFPKPTESLLWLIMHSISRFVFWAFDLSVRPSGV